MNLNRIVLIGRLVADPEQRFSGDEMEISKFRIAVDRPVRRDRDDRENTDFFNIVCFGQRAKFVNQYLHRGYLVAVEGRLQMDQYTDRDGNQRTWVEVNADNVQNLTPRDQAEAVAGGGRGDHGDDHRNWESGRGGRGGARGGGRGDDDFADNFDDRPAAGGRDAAAAGGGRRTQSFGPPEETPAGPGRGPATTDAGPFDDDEDDPFTDEI